MSDDHNEEIARHMHAVRMPPRDEPPAQPAPLDYNGWRELQAVYARLGPIERKALQMAAERLLAGQHRYGVLQADDPRDFRGKESAEESCDRLNYFAIDAVLHRSTPPEIA